MESAVPNLVLYFRKMTNQLLDLPLTPPKLTESTRVMPWNPFPYMEDRR